MIKHIYYLNTIVVYVLDGIVVHIYDFLTPVPRSV
jgi:hypothetical protein